MKKILLLHGALGAKSQFEPWLPILNDHFEVYRMNFEGHGTHPGADRPFRIEYFADNLEEFIHDKKVEGIDVFGYSMGGYVAMYLAARKPDLLGKIFTFASKLDWNPETSAKEVKMLNPDKIEEKVPKFAQALAQRHSGTNWKGVLHKTAEMMLELGNHPALKSDDFGKLTQPVRMGIGDHDNMVSLEETIEAYRKLPNGQLFVMPDTPHPIEKIDKYRICESVVRFFKD